MILCIILIAIFHVFLLIYNTDKYNFVRIIITLVSLSHSKFIQGFEIYHP
jgi:hypothetical protein